jgi:hypothetical protein
MKDGYFEHTRGGFTIYTDAENDALSSARFLLGRFGEDPELLVARFWKEWGDGEYSVVPLLFPMDCHPANPCARREVWQRPYSPYNWNQTAPWLCDGGKSQTRSTLVGPSD